MPADFKYVVVEKPPACILKSEADTYGGCDGGPEHFVVGQSEYGATGYYCKLHADMVCRQLNLDRLTSQTARPFGITVDRR